jgi:hypothetical protein
MLWQLKLRPNSSDLLLDFMIASVFSVLSARLFVHFTGRWQLAFGDWHIAHVIWGGLLMLFVILSIILFEAKNKFLTLLSIVGGYGWGLFLDEIGKYISRDNNYWFRPAVIFIYIFFILLFLLYRFTRHRQPNRLDPFLLPDFVFKFINFLFPKLVKSSFLLTVLVIFSIYYSVDKIVDLVIFVSNFRLDYLLLLKFIFDTISSLLIIIGWIYFFRRRLRLAVHIFRFSLLLNIFLGAVFKFYYEQFSAIIYLLVNLFVFYLLGTYRSIKKDL